MIMKKSLKSFLLATVLCFCGSNNLTTTENPLIEAVCNGNLTSVRNLVNEKNINTSTKNGETLLILAIANRHEEIIDALWEYKPNINAKTSQGNTALYGAARNGLLEAMDKLLELGADFDAENQDGDTVLYGAVESNQIEAVEKLLGKGADIEKKGKRYTHYYTHGYTPLMLATVNNSTEITEKLLKYNANVNAVDNSNHTALYRAAENDHSEIAKMLLEKGENINIEAKDNYGGTPLNTASILCNKKVMVELLKHKANVNAVDDFGSTILHQVVTCNKDVIEVLWEYEPNVNALRGRETPLIKASRYCKKDAMEEFVKHNADVNIVDNKGLTAYDLASSRCINGEENIVKQMIEGTEYSPAIVTVGLMILGVICCWIARPVMKVVLECLAKDRIPQGSIVLRLQQKESQQEQTKEIQSQEATQKLDPKIQPENKKANKVSLDSKKPTTIQRVDQEASQQEQAKEILSQEATQKLDPKIQPENKKANKVYLDSKKSTTIQGVDQEASQQEQAKEILSQEAIQKLDQQTQLENEVENEKAKKVSLDSKKSTTIQGVDQEATRKLELDNHKFLSKLTTAKGGVIGVLLVALVAFTALYMSESIIYKVVQSMENLETYSL